MISFLIGFCITFFGIIFLTIMAIAFSKRSKKKKEPKEDKHEKTKDSHHDNHAHEKDSHGHEAHGHDDHGHSHGANWNKRVNVFIPLILLVALVFGIWKLIQWYSSDDSSSKNQNLTQNQMQTSNSTSTSYNENYILKKNQIIKVSFKSCYEYEIYCSDSLQKKEEGGEWHTIGGSRSYDNGSRHVSYFEIKSFSDNVNVRIEFQPSRDYF